MPAHRKTWLPSGNQSSSKPTTTAPSAAQLLANSPDSLKPSIPIWALSALITALLGRDNRKIHPSRTERLLEALKEFVLLVDATEAQGIAFPHTMKAQWVAWFTRDTLTIKPPAHPRHILALHSHYVDMFLEDKDWPIKTEGKRNHYVSTLDRHLPTLLAELSNRQHCNSGCPGNCFPDLEDLKAFAILTSSAALRDAIVAFHHGIAPDSMRGARVGRRFRRRLKK